MILFMRKYLVVLLFWILVGGQLLAQGDYLQHGSPLIRNYTTEEYNGTDQVWAIGQDHRGVMYFGEGKGLLEYDGTNWRTYQVANASIVRSLAISDDGVIYVGANNEFGYFKPNAYGLLTYYSLNKYLPQNVENYQNVWKTYITSEGVYYISRNYVFWWDYNKLEVIPVLLQAMFAFEVDGNVYIKDDNRGVLKLEGSKLISLPNCDDVNTYKAGYFEINSYETGQLLMAFSNKGFYKYDLTKQELKKLKYSNLAEAYIKENLGFKMVKASDDEWAYCTIEGGIIFINRQGEVTRIINEARGLSTNCIYDIFFDNSGNLWAATQFGISRIDLSNSLVKYTKKQGVSDYIMCFKWHNNTQYFGTSINVYYLPEYSPTLNNDNHKAQIVEGIDDCWDLIDVKGHLIACHWMGLSEVSGDKAHTLLKERRVYCGLYDEKHHPEAMFLGQIDGVLLALIKEETETNRIVVRDTFKLKGFTGQVRSMVYDADGHLWIATYNRGVVLVRFGDDISTYTVTRFTDEDGLPSAYNEASVNCFNGKVNVFTHKGIYKPVYPDRGQPDSLIYFEADRYWGPVYSTDSTSALLADQVSDDQFFLFGGYSGIVEVGADSISVLHAPFVRITDAYSIEVAEERYIQFGTSDAFYIYDSKGEKDYNEAFNVLIRQVRLSNDSVIFAGMFYDDTKDRVSFTQPDDAQLELLHNQNSLKLNFSATYYEESEKNLYQYYLEGFDEGWSNWSFESSATYTNIPAGHYAFKVRAKNIYGTISEVNTFSFQVLPDWYETWWAYLAYFFMGMFLVWLFVYIYTGSLKRKNLRLESVVHNRTLELENAIQLLEQQKIELNEQQQEVLSRNEELSLKQKELEHTINQLKEAQVQLIQTEKMASLGILTAGVAHEINNPLNYIMGGYVGLKSYFEDKDDGDNEDVNILLSSIDTGIQRAANIVQGLNQFSRNNEGYNEVCDIHSIINNCLAMLHSELKEKVSVTKNFCSIDLFVLGNVGKLHQVIVNVISNANHAITAKGTIVIDTYKKEGKVYVVISDDGIGISKENLPRITDPFFTTKEAGDGTGLGLSISYNIVQEHKGMINFESIEGEGTKVTILLPEKIEA